MATRTFISRRQMLGLTLGLPQIWSNTPCAQDRAALRRIGYLMGYPEDDPEGSANVAAFREGLMAAGLEEGRSVHIDYRWAGVDQERARSLARELIALKPDLIVASTNQVVSILMQETRSVPVVFVFIGDPIGSGYAATIAHPGANLTRILKLRGADRRQVAGDAEGARTGDEASGVCLSSIPTGNSGRRPRRRRRHWVWA